MTTQANHIRMRLGPKKRHVTDSLTLAKQVQDSDVECEKLEDSASICWERRDHLKLHLDGYKKLHIELEDAALQEGDPEWKKVCDEADEYLDLKYEADSAVSQLGSCLASIQEKLEINLKVGASRADASLVAEKLKLEFQKLELQKQEMEFKKLKWEKSEETEKSKTQSVKLPKLEFMKFNGMVLKWPAFYDAFEAAVDSNPNLLGVDKFNYLHSRLEGDALEVTGGMTLTNAKYDKAKDTLNERYGRQDVIVNAHYKSLVNLPVSSSTTSALHHTYDAIEKHLRSLEAINRDVESQLLITMLLSKFPKQVLTQISEKKSDADNWTVNMIRKSLKKYIENREFADLHCQQDDTESQSSVRSTTEAFYTGSGMAKPLQPKCHFCKNSHWSDECNVFQTISDRKTRVKGHCFMCLR